MGGDLRESVDDMDEGTDDLVISYWNKMINFYTRYTDEIERVENEMISYVKEENIPINKRSQLYLHYLRSDLDNLLFNIFKFNL